MSASSWFSLLAICALGAISPGPSLAAVMKSTIQGSRFHGIVTALAHAFGIVFMPFWLLPVLRWSLPKRLGFTIS